MHPESRPRERELRNARRSLLFPIRWLVLLATISAIVVVWWITGVWDRPGVRVLGAYRERYFLLNLLVSYFGLSIAIFWALRVRRRILFVWIAITLGTGFTFMLLEAVAIVGLVDFRPLLLGRDRNPDFEYELRRKGQPDQYWEGEFEYDLVDRMGIEAESSQAVFATDAFGLRNPPGITEPSVFVLGDSIVVGMPVPVEETVAQRVGQLADVPTLAVAEVGYAPQESLGRLRALGLARPGAVVLHLLFEGNDLMDSRKWNEWRQRPFRSDWPLSGLFKTLMETLKTAAPSSSTQSRMGWLRESAGRREKIYFLYDARHTDAEIAELDRLASDLAKAATAFAEQAIPYLIVMVPQKLTVFHPVLEWPDESPLSSPDQATSRFRRSMAKFAATHGLDYLDVTEALRGCLDSGDLPFYPADTHLAPCGHDAIARAVAPWTRAALAAGTTGR